MLKRLVFSPWLRLAHRSGAAPGGSLRGRWLLLDSFCRPHGEFCHPAIVIDIHNQLYSALPRSLRLHIEGSPQPLHKDVVVAEHSA